MDEPKVALITGAASGIGAGIAELFAESGYAVAAVDIDGEGVKRMARKLSAHASAIAIPADIGVEDQAQAAVASVIREFGTLSVLVNNAGIEVGGAITDLDVAQWDRQIAVNLRGAFLMSRYSIPAMRQRGGAIIHVSSVHAFVSWAGSAAYDATKAGLLGLTRAMAIDHGPEGIRVNAICPGYIDTPLMEKWLDSVSDREATMRQVLGVHPVGRIGTPRDVAQAALFLASDAASFISGTCLVVDGGMTAQGH
ncbi:MAG: SDR family oxidoreductase [Acidobacteriota bacterium]|nr:SDR family oxidoreductase [Acidobacteriota bacterium]